MKPGFLFRLSVGCVVLLLALSVARAATFNIANGDVYGPSGLINVLTTCNSNGQDDTINLASNGTYVLTGINNNTFGPTGTPVILPDGMTSNFHSVTINANGSTIMRSTVAGTPEFRLFRVANQNVENKYLTITGAILRNGHAGSDNGGAIYSVGLLALNSCTLENNSARRGGAITNGAYILQLNRCALLNNSATQVGGAVYNDSGEAYLINSTLAGNTAVGQGDGVMTEGGATGARTEIHQCTLSGNGIANYELPRITEVILSNTIFSSSPIFTDPGASPFSQVVSAGYNLSTDNGNGRLTATGDQINADPKLDPQGPQFNGGATRTIALLSGSAALDKGLSNGLTTDQRGSARPLDNPAIGNASGGDGSDIGAFEASTDVLQSGPTFVVTTNTDHDDGNCGALDCTLREAIARSNVVTGSNTITFAPAVTGTITLQPAAGDPLTISDPLKVNGPGARVLRVSGNNAQRVFQFTSGPSELTGLTIHGGLVQPVGRPGAAGLGGGILNQAQLTVRDCAFLANQALGAAGLFEGEAGGSGNGGAVANEGFVTFERCAFRENIALGATGAAKTGVFQSGGAGGAARGAAVYNAADSTVAIYNCTFANNLAQGGSGGNGHFGGGGGAARGAIYNERDLALYASTVSNNTSGGGAGGTGNSPINNGAPGTAVGGIETASGFAPLVQNCIVAANFGNNGGGPDAQGTFASDGYNLIGNGDTSTGFSEIGDQVGTFAAPLDPKLGPVQNNGGPTDTMALLTGSPALDQGISDFFTSTDQRGQSRPNDNPFIANASGGNGSDVGAFEFGGILAVTTVADGDDGACTISHCTLREAISAANAQAGDEIIAFLPGVSGIIQLGSPLPILSTNITLQGPGSSVVTVRRNAGGNYRIFAVGNGTGSGPMVTISGLTIANGRAPTGAFPIGSGGGIQNDRGQLTVRECVLTGNASDLSAFTYGGGIFNYKGTLTVDRCTLEANEAQYGGGLANYDASSGTGANSTITASTFSANNAAYGGALYNQGSSSSTTTNVSLTNCTLSGNAANTEGGAVYNAGANSGSAYSSLTDCTVTGNSAATGGGIYNFSNASTAVVFLRNTILKTGASGANVINNAGMVQSSGNNLTSDNTGFASGSGDLRNTDPQLGPLASYGGPTQTHALLPGSPAINAGASSFAPTQDQRGFFYSGANDIGAFEFNGFELRIISIARNGNDLAITFQGAANRAFRLERRSSLLDGAWSNIAGAPDVTPPADGPATFTDPNAFALGEAFYRVRLLP